jgi:hypothetical protein
MFDAFDNAVMDVAAGQSWLNHIQRIFWEGVNEFNEDAFKNSSSKNYWYETVLLNDGGTVDVLYFSELPPQNGRCCLEDGRLQNTDEVVSPVKKECCKNDRKNKLDKMWPTEEMCPTDFATKFVFSKDSPVSTCIVNQSIINKDDNVHLLVKEDDLVESLEEEILSSKSTLPLPEDGQVSIGIPLIWLEHCLPPPMYS